MKEDPRIEDMPTPNYVRRAWAEMHEHHNDQTMRAWEVACQRAKNAACKWLRENPDKDGSEWEPDE